MRFAYADPPYLGCCGMYGHDHREPFGCWDETQTHLDLIVHLTYNFPDGWALSCSTPSLRTILGYCGNDVRVGAWVKPFASFKPHVNPGYCWEPVVFRGGRQPRSRTGDTVRDFVSCNITLKKGLTGAKPQAVCRWIADFLGYREGDELVDLFPGTGVMGRTLAQGVLA